VTRLVVWVLAAAVLVQVCAGCSAWQAAPVGGGPAGVASDSAVVRLLTARAAAVLGADRAALASTVATGADRSATGLAARLAGVELTSWSYQVQRVTPGPRPWQRTVQVLLSYRLMVDPAASPPATARRLMVLVPDPARAGDLLLSSEQPVGAWLPWDVAPVLLSSAGDAAVLDVRAGSADLARTAQAAGLLGSAQRAVAAVSAVWGTGWRRSPVVVAVGGADDLAHLTGRTTASVTGLVAVTTTDRVYVDMHAYLALSAAGRQVLLSHEVTHLATGAASDPRVPQWLKEGFADYVGFLGSGIGAPIAAAGLLRAVRAGRVPATLPADAAFSAGALVAADAYAGAWLACGLLAADRGQQILVRVYRATSAGRASPAWNVDAALRAVTGRGTAAWTARWQAWLARLAAPPRPAGLPAAAARAVLGARS
jgi:hypothetical protein